MESLSEFLKNKDILKAESNPPNEERHQAQLEQINLEQQPQDFALQPFVIKAKYRESALTKPF